MDENDRNMTPEERRTMNMNRLMLDVENELMEREEFIGLPERRVAEIDRVTGESIEEIERRRLFLQERFDRIGTSIQRTTNTIDTLPPVEEATVRNTTEQPAWRNETWETEFVDTSYTTLTEHKPTLTMDIENHRRDLLRVLSDIYCNSPCSICKKLYKFAADIIEHLINVLGEGKMQENKIKNLEREIDRYIGQMAEYKRIADISQLGRNVHHPEAEPPHMEPRRR